MKKLLREYEEFIENWDEIRFETYQKRDYVNPNKIIPYFRIRFVRHVVQYGYDKQPTAYEQDTRRHFLFTLEELDKAIDRYRKKVSYEKTKRDEEQD